MHRRRFITAAASTALAGVAAGCSSDDGGAAEDPADMNGTDSPGAGMGDQTATDMGDGTETDMSEGTDTEISGEIDNQDENLEITEAELTRTESETYVSGVVENVGEEDAENIEVTVTLYDDEDSELYAFSDSTEQEEIQALAPGETWEFKVVFDDINMEEVASYIVTAEGEVP